MFLLLTSAANAQRRPEVRAQEEVDERVALALTTDRTEGKLGELANEFNLHGSFTFDLTVNDKGRTETVFAVGGSIENVADRNRLKQHLMALHFDFKLPKGTRTKTHQSLDFP